MNRLGKLFGMAMVAVALCAVPAGVEAQQLQRKQVAQTQQQRSDAAYAAFNAGDYDKAYSIARPLAVRCAGRRTPTSVTRVGRRGARSSTM